LNPRHGPPVNAKVADLTTNLTTNCYVPRDATGWRNRAADAVPTDEEEIEWPDRVDPVRRMSGRWGIIAGTDAHYLEERGALSTRPWSAACVAGSKSDPP